MLTNSNDDFLSTNEQTQFQNYLDTLWNIFQRESAVQELKKKQRIMRKKAFTHFSTDISLELVFLTLYYITPLTIEEILSLTPENITEDSVISPKTKRKIPISENFQDLLIFVSSLYESKESRIFGKRNLQWGQHVILKYPNSGLERELGLYSIAHQQTDFGVIPTPLKLKADPNYRGKGVTIAFIDSGFYPHPDLTEPYNRILAYYDTTQPKATLYDLNEASDQSWHGMQTSVSCAGNGYLSKGLYRGIASEANVVLIKVCGPHGSSTENIVEGFNWIIRNKEKYNIRVLNISLGSHQDVSFTESEIDRAAELAVHAGIIVVAAAGNDPSMPTTPPGNSPSVITVGGSDDQNQLNHDKIQMYWSSFGRTKDGYFKPEIVAPGIWVPAPILPNTQVYREAACLFELKATSDNHLRKNLRKASKNFSFLEKLSRKPLEQIRQFIEQRIRKEKLIAQYYQHVDGTSFSSPITCSVIAQMLQVNPDLNPRQVKEILLETADPLKNEESERQGRGMINPAEALRTAQNYNKTTQSQLAVTKSPQPQIKDNSVTFTYKTDDSSIKKVALVGDFNGWSIKRHKMEFDEEKKQWQTELFFPMRGTYHYKYYVDDSKWVNDPNNSWKEEDGFGGSNNLFKIAQSRKMKNLTKTIDEVLVTIPQISHNDPRRPKAIKHLDRLLQLPDSNINDYIRNYFISRLSKVLHSTKKEFPSREAILWQLYNQGYLLQVKGLNVGFDIVTTRNVFNLYWSIPEPLVQELAASIDILFISHRHPDHMDLGLIERMIRLEKLVVAPKEIVHLLPRRVIGLEGNEERQLLAPHNRHIRLNVFAHRGRHVFDNNRFISHRNYEIETESGFCVLHTGDHDYTDFLKHISDIDILIFKYGGISPKITDQEAVSNLIKTFRARMFIPSGMNEIGHHGYERFSYESVKETFEDCPVPYHILSWGESLIIP